MREFNGTFFKNGLVFRSKFFGVIGPARMEYIRSFLNYFRGTDTERNTRDQEITDRIFNKFLSGIRSDEDNNIPGDHDPFFGSQIMDVPNVDSNFENLMNEMEKHFLDMMGFQGFSGFNIEDFEGQEFENNKQLTGDSLRDHYLNTGETDINPGVNQQIVKIEPSSIEPVRYNYQTIRKIMYKVNEDGTAELTRIFKDGEGREERNVTKFKLF